MIKAFYDSLDTLQKVQFATKKDYINLWIGVAVSVIIFGAFFIGIDTIWSGLYKSFHNAMRGADYTTEQLYDQGEFDSNGSLLDSVDLSAPQVEIDGWSVEVVEEPLE